MCIFMRESKLSTALNTLWSRLDSTVVLRYGLTSNTELKVVSAFSLSIWQLLRNSYLRKQFLMNFITSNLLASSKKNSTKLSIERSSKISNLSSQKVEGWFLRIMTAFWPQENLNHKNWNLYQSMSLKIEKAWGSMSMLYPFLSVSKTTLKATNTIPSAWKSTLHSSLSSFTSRPTQLSSGVWYHLRPMTRSSIPGQKMER